MAETPSSEDDAVVHLTSDEAVVLFELLSRWQMDESFATPSRDCFESTAEGAVLNRIQGMLEAQLVAPFRSDYLQILLNARRKLEGQWDYMTLRG